MTIRKSVLAFIVLVVAAATTMAEPIERSQVYVKDGDTIIKGSGTVKSTKDQEYRLVDFDTPETTRAKCPMEIEKGTRAAARLIELLDNGQLDLTDIPCSCTQRAIETGRCNFGRRCGRLTVNGKDVGETLIAEGHAVPYHCSATRCPKQRSWCPEP